LVRGVLAEGNGFENYPRAMMMHPNLIAITGIGEHYLVLRLCNNLPRRQPRNGIPSLTCDVPSEKASRFIITENEPTVISKSNTTL
jgi:hypothetical protein